MRKLHSIAAATAAARKGSCKYVRAAISLNKNHFLIHRLVVSKNVTIKLILLCKHAAEPSVGHRFRYCPDFFAASAAANAAIIGFIFGIANSAVDLKIFKPSQCTFLLVTFKVAKKNISYPISGKSNIS